MSHVSIVCAANSHPTKRAVIEQFHWWRDKDGDEPLEAAELGAGGGGWVAVGTLRLKEWPEQLIEPGGAVNPGRFTFRRGIRRRYVFKCPLCKAPKTVRGERLVTFLEDARHADRRELPLGLL